MKKTRKEHLPFNWRVRVAEDLAQQGIQLTSQQVADLARYPLSNPELSVKVLDARKRIQKKHEAAMKKLKALQDV